jgi:hypothetical protein
VTAPFIAEAERAAVIAAQDAIYRTVPSAVIPRWDVAKEVVAAVVPILAEHFAQSVTDTPFLDYTINGEPGFIRKAEVLRVIRAAATPTEG